MQQSYPKPKNQKGYLLLIAVLVVAAVSTSVATTLLLLGVGSVRSSLAVEHGQRARDLADSCAAEALHRLALDNTYTGNETIAIGDESCNIATVTGAGDSNRVVQTTGIYGQATRRVEVNVTTVGPPMAIAQWEEIADF